MSRDSVFLLGTLGGAVYLGLGPSAFLWLVGGALLGALFARAVRP